MIRENRCGEEEEFGVRRVLGSSRGRRNAFGFDGDVSSSPAITGAFPSICSRYHTVEVADRPYKRSRMRRKA